MDRTDEIFFALLRSGLWGRTEALPEGEIDWNAVISLSDSQAVTGIIADGLSEVRRAFPGCSPDSAVSGRVVRTVLGIEMMNARIESALSSVCGELNAEGIVCCLLKGQGVARNYPVPSHRSPGDIDLLFDGRNYPKASALLVPKADRLSGEAEDRKHFGMFFGNVEIELHGTLHTFFGKRFNRKLDRMQARLFQDEDFREWNCNGVQVRLPSAGFDAVFIFTHLLQHFYYNGLGLRQVCDWMMHISRNSPAIDRECLASTLRSLGIMEAWKAFGAMAVELLGMPEDEMPFYDRRHSDCPSRIWKAIRLYGNFGSGRYAGRDYVSESFLVRKFRSLRYHCSFLPVFFRLSRWQAARWAVWQLTDSVRSIAREI